MYFEIKQSADAFSVTRSLYCKTNTEGGGDFAVTVEFTAAQPALMAKVKNDGRKGTSVKSGDGCKVDIEKMYRVFGATLPYYLDPKNPMPTAEEKSMDGKPGWEDWDMDGNPGITGVTAGTVVGKIFVAPREWSSFSGTVPSVASTFKLSMSWDQEPNVMAYDGSPFLSATAVRAADNKLHFAQLARLSDTQGTGDDAAICKSMVALAAMLTPEAAGM